MNHNLIYIKKLKFIVYTYFLILNGYMVETMYSITLIISPTITYSGTGLRLGPFLRTIALKLLGHLALIAESQGHTLCLDERKEVYVLCHPRRALVIFPEDKPLREFDWLVPALCGFEQIPIMEWKSPIQSINQALEEEQQLHATLV